MLGQKIVLDIAKSVYSVQDEIVYAGKRPHFKNDGIYFSISHSGNLVAVVFDEKTVGIDIEFVRPRNLNKLLNRYNLPKNYSLTDFYKWWTAYEAKYKNPDGNTQTFTLLADYICSISSCGAVNCAWPEILEF